MLDQFLKNDYDKFIDNRKNNIKTYTLNETYDKEDIEIAIFINEVDGEITLGVQYNDSYHEVDYVYNTTYLSSEVNELKLDVYEDIKEDLDIDDFDIELFDKFFVKIEKQYLNFKLNKELPSNNQKDKRKLKI